MKITLESTDRIVHVTTADGKVDMPCRVWEGVSERGAKIQALVPRIALLPGEDSSQFAAELQETHAPHAVEQAFPMRLIL